MKPDLISRISDVVTSWEGLSFFVSLLAGVGCLAFVAVSWSVHLWTSNQYLESGVIAVVVLAVSLGALARVPLALLLLFGGAMVVITVFSMGGIDAVMPP